MNIFPARVTSRMWRRRLLPQHVLDDEMSCMCCSAKGCALQCSDPQTNRITGSNPCLRCFHCFHCFHRYLVGLQSLFPPKVAQRMHLAALRASIAELDLRQRTPPGPTKFKDYFASMNGFRWLQMVSDGFSNFTCTIAVLEVWTPAVPCLQFFLVYLG